MKRGWGRRSRRIAAAAACVLAAYGAPSGARAASPLVALLTDYGTRDAYVAILKGTVLAGCPDARIVDLTHEVPAFDVRAGARMLYAAAREFPPNTVFVAVVDPGVGTARRPVALRTRDGKIFVGPDNGIFTLVADSLGVAGAWVLENQALWRDPASVSHTFHGRDIFGPVAGRLACGTPPSEAGPAAGQLVRVDLPVATFAGGVVRGEVERADVYGNLLTNIGGQLLEEAGLRAGHRLLVQVGDREIALLLVRTYADVPEGAPLALVTSDGRLELAVNQGSLAELLAAGAGAPVEVAPDAVPESR